MNTVNKYFNLVSITLCALCSLYACYKGDTVFSLIFAAVATGALLSTIGTYFNMVGTRVRT